MSDTESTSATSGASNRKKIASQSVEVRGSLATILRIFAKQTGPVPFATIEAQAGIGAKTGLYATTAGLINKGVVLHTGGPAPIRREESIGKGRMVPRVEFDRDNALLEMPAAARAVVTALLG
jgi:hypothetical protein